jgi:hypothetical protein
MNGDVNSDGVVSVSDVQCVVLSALDLTPEDPLTTPDCLISVADADLDCSSGATVVDIQLSVQMVLGALVGGSGLPASKDIDNDQIIAGCDLCPDDFDPDQLDSDGDGLGDACDPTPVECGQAQVTCPGASPPTWELENKHPGSEGHGESFGLSTYSGGVVVVMLTAAW